ncbi:glycoside hydrolase family 16 protein [Kordiimonas lacus]|uniref:Glycosyl hydrolases family 16 n=1 Tax=Kordiimonas lacus TaxID=637679 RepID=A0A1G7D845_9PROT|nr:glycoside hydrolase family 16 protein [Kordiimonas lacus]SDE47703.1 Glycosyl hydrolases family 16 [Kordiimonas lacus]
MTLMKLVSVAGVLAAMSTAVLSDDGYELVWADEFDGPELNTNVWRVVKGNGCPTNCGFGNNELQAYRGGEKNLRVQDGKLVIEARMGNKVTSAKITTQDMPGWIYGRFAMRAKLPSGVGTWPAFWMMPKAASYGPWPKSGEIDIMEHVGYNPGQVHGTIHTEAYNHKIGTQKGDFMQVPDAAEVFHDYAVEWEEDEIRWYIDGQEYYRIEKEAGDGHAEWPLDHPFYVILNLAVGGDWGGAEGVDKAAFPARFEVDWVRVWQKTADK